ncbi:MAG: hypothetical protein ACYTG4_09890 [Planctomycetota bacterium]
MVLLVGIGVALWAAFDSLMAVWAYTWPETKATVTWRGTEKRFAYKSTYTVTVGSFAYEVEGEAYKGTEYAYGVREWITAPRLNAEISIRYCPLAPEVAVMHPGLVSDHFIWLAIGLGIVLICTIPVRAWRRRREADARTAAAKAEARARRADAN